MCHTASTSEFNLKAVIYNFYFCQSSILLVMFEFMIQWVHICDTNTLTYCIAIITCSLFQYPICSHLGQYRICYKRKSVLILTMVFNLFAPMRAIYMFVFVQFVFPVCFCCNAPCFIGLILLQRTWMMICNENIFTCMFSPKIRKKCSNMVMLLTSVYEYGWMPNMF